MIAHDAQAPNLNKENAATNPATAVNAKNGTPNKSECFYPLNGEFCGVLDRMLEEAGYSHRATKTIAIETLARMGSLSFQGNWIKIRNADLCKLLSLSQPAVTNRLKVLADSGIIKRVSSNQGIYFRCLVTFDTFKKLIEEGYTSKREDLEYTYPSAKEMERVLRTWGNKEAPVKPLEKTPKRRPRANLSVEEIEVEMADQGLEITEQEPKQQATEAGIQATQKIEPEQPEQQLSEKNPENGVNKGLKQESSQEAASSASNQQDKTPAQAISNARIPTAEQRQRAIEIRIRQMKEENKLQKPEQAIRRYLGNNLGNGEVFMINEFEEKRLEEERIAARKEQQKQQQEKQKQQERQEIERQIDQFLENLSGAEAEAFNKKLNDALPAWVKETTEDNSVRRRVITENRRKLAREQIRLAMLE